MREITAMFNVLLKVVLLTSVLTSPILAEDKTIYALLGGEIVLFPEPFSGTLKRVVWKQGDDKAAEWEEGPIECYREFKGRTTLDTGTGTMTLKDLTASFSGIYLAEINGKQASKTSELRVIGRVSPPNTAKECDTKTECTLHCKGENTTDGRYAWIKDVVELPSSSSSLTVQLDGVYDSSYTCKYSNPVSSALGEPLIPFPSTHSPGTIAGIICGAALLLAAAVCGGLAYKLKYKPPCIKKTGDENTGAKDGRAEESKACIKKTGDENTGAKDGRAEESKACIKKTGGKALQTLQWLHDAVQIHVLINHYLFSVLFILLEYSGRHPQ
ncbi:uncharacterized protein LOC133116637 isoform X5 [Conger conger]|uniref:uncharacterized protein LOC133116637 isoform X5 n=1 Tax=Conger conger TaxID=82655 RepID=UPI002A599BE3|nr:uncharacterized protein LOC133116637 isoform X5 [Conger conger]